MGAAGLTSSSFEMAARGGVGIELDLDRVPTREAGMTPYEIMLSESQERMLLVLRRGAEKTARAIFEKWGLDCAVIGRVIETGAMVLRFDGREVAQVPIARGERGRACLRASLAAERSGLAGERARRPAAAWIIPARSGGCLAARTCAAGAGSFSSTTRP